MSPQEQAAFHVPTEVEVAAEDASRASSLPNIVEHRIVELQAVAKANVAASKRPRFRRVVEPELADWTQEDPATVESEPTAGLDDEPAPDQAAGDGANEAASADVAEEPHQEEEVPEAVAASAAAPPESATPKRAPGPGRKARTSRQRRPGSSGKGRPRGSGHRRPRPGTTSKPKDATHDDDVVPTRVDDPEPTRVDDPEPTRVDDPEPTPVDTVEPLSAAEDSDAPAEVPMGHSPRRPRRVASRAKETVVVPDADDQPIPIHLNGEVAVEPDPPEEADLRPIAGGDGSQSPTPAARRLRPRSHLPESSVASEE